MGGLFRAPKPVVVRPPPPPAAVPAPAVVPSDPATIAADARAEARVRAGGGRAGTIATSEREVLAALPGLTRKSLLGE